MASKPTKRRTVIVPKRGNAYTDEQLARNKKTGELITNYKREIPGDCEQHGRSRIWGDAPFSVQLEVINRYVDQAKAALEV